MAISPPPVMGAESFSVWPPDSSPLALTVMVTSPRFTCVTGRREAEAGDRALISREPPHARSASTSAATTAPITILRVISFRPSSLQLRLKQRHHRAGLDPFHRDFVRIARQQFHIHRAVAALFRDIHDGFAIAREHGLGRDTDGIGDAFHDHIHVPIHGRLEPGIGLPDVTVGPEAAGGGPLEALDPNSVVNGN